MGVDTEGRVGSRGSREAGKNGGFGHGELGSMFGKVSLGGGFDTVGGTTIGNMVKVHFQYLVLGIAGFDCEGEESFFDFALDGTAGSKEGVFD